MSCMLKKHNMAQWKCSKENSFHKFNLSFQVHKSVVLLVNNLNSEVLCWFSQITAGTNGSTDSCHTQ